PGFPVTQLANWSKFLLGTARPPWPSTADLPPTALSAKGAAPIHIMSDTYTRARYQGVDYVSLDDPAELTRIAMADARDILEDPTDFSKLEQSGAKMIIWHGVNDDSMSYHENLKAYQEIKARFPSAQN